MRLRAFCLGTALAMVLGVFSLNSVVAGEGDTPKGEFTSTHKQARIIKPLHDGKPIALHTYCLDKDGNILACVGGDNVQVVMNADGTQETKTVPAPKLIQVYSPDGELKKEIELTFAPTAINLTSDGTIFVAGHGKIAKVSSDGKVLSTADSPHIGDMATFKERVEAGARKQVEEFTQQFRDQIKRIDERIAKLKEKPEAEITEKDRKRLETYEEQKALYEEQLKSQESMYKDMFSGDQMLDSKLGITALAVTSKDIFVCCNAIEGYGYEVWRMNHEFSEPKQVVAELGGCCGQCDIQANEEHLILAENTKFKVGLLDRDGNRVFDFGKGDRKAVDGFGSCCNPMNVRCCSNGDILTAESSIGTIKRFNEKGELLGVVGKAKIGGGCKHVALGYDEQRNRYYMMNVDKSHICVLVPNAEAPETTPEELLAKAAREGLGRKLVGEWSLNGKRKAEAKPAASGLGALIGGLIGGEGGETVATDDPYGSSYLHFHEDGKLSMTGGIFEGGDNGWEAVSQDGNTLIVSQIQDQIQYYDYKIEFVNDDEATITLMFNESVMSSNRYKRVKDEPAADQKANESAPVEKKTEEPAAEQK